MKLNGCLTQLLCASQAPTTGVAFVGARHPSKSKWIQITLSSKRCMAWESHHSSNNTRKYSPRTSLRAYISWRGGWKRYCKFCWGWVRRIAIGIRIERGLGIWYKLHVDVCTVSFLLVFQVWYYALCIVSSRRHFPARPKFSPLCPVWAGCDIGLTDWRTGANDQYIKYNMTSWSVHLVV